MSNSEYGAGTKTVQTETAVDLNQAENTNIRTHTFVKPARVTRFGIIGVTGTLPVALDVKLRRAARGTPTTFTDITGADIDGGVDFAAAGAIGDVRSKRVGAQVAAASDSVYDFEAGEVIQLAIKTSAGATCTAQGFIEFFEFGYNINGTSVTDLSVSA